MHPSTTSQLGLLLALLAPFCSAQECDTANGWYGNEGVGACYHLGELTDPGAAHPELTWFESVKFCEDEIPGKSFLATIRNQAQQDFIRSVILGVGPQYVWISGNELVSEGSYEWGFNTGDIVEFFEWAGGQPNNVICAEGGNQCTNDQDCLSLDAASQYALNDLGCQALAEPLCQYNP